MIKFKKFKQKRYELIKGLVDKYMYHTKGMTSIEIMEVIRKLLQVLVSWYD